MNKTKTDRHAVPVDEPLDPEVVSFRARFDQKSPLDELVREGARRMLQSAIDAEVDAFIAQHADRRDQQGRRQVVKNGSLPERKILTGAGAIPVTQGRVRDNHPDPDKRVTFTPNVLPSYLRTAIEELIPWLYLKGISTGDFAGGCPVGCYMRCWKCRSGNAGLFRVTQSQCDCEDFAFFLVNLYRELKRPLVSGASTWPIGPFI